MFGNKSANETLIVSRSAARSTIRDALRLYVGRGRRYSVKQLSNGTGVPDRVIESAICDPESTDYRPLPIEALLSISGFLGAEFASEWLKLAALGAFDLPEEEDPSPGEIAADSTEDAAEIARRAADGEFCAEDRKALKVVGQRKIERGMRLVACAARAA